MAKRKRVLITGGANGLGKELVKRLSNDNAIVFALDKDEKGLEALKKECPKVTVRTVDLQNWKDTKEVVQKLGPMDLLVNNAGIMKVTPFLQIAEEEANLMFDVNFKSMISVGQVVVQQMIDSKIEGVIVNVASLSSKYSIPGLGLYSSTKAAVCSLTKTMAVELGPHNIRVNAVCPRAMNTDMLKNVMTGISPENNRLGNSTSSRAIIKQFLETENVTDLILFLLSPLSLMMTGDSILIDGGISAN